MPSLLYLHIHIPSLYDLSCDVATRQVVNDGVERLHRTMPYGVYLYILQVHVLNGSDQGQTHLLRYKQMRRRRVNMIDVYPSSSMSTLTLISLVRHIDMTHISAGAVLDVFRQLCACNDYTDDFVGCIFDFAPRIESMSRRISLMSAGLSYCPNRRIRNALFDNGARLDTYDDNYTFIAAGTGMYHVIESLSDDVLISTVHDGHHKSLLDYATHSSDVRIVEMMLNRGVKASYTALANAMMTSNIECMDLLYTHLKRDHADVERFADWWRHVHSVDVAQWLLDHEFNVNDAVFYCCRNDHIFLVQYLVEQCGVVVNSNFLDSIMWTYPSIDMINYLSKHGCDVRGLTKNGRRYGDEFPLYKRFFTDIGAYDVV